MTNCTVANNSAGAGGGLVYAGTGGASLRACIVWGNEGTRVSGTDNVWPVSNFALSYTKVGGADPLFVNADGIDGTGGNEDDNYRLACNSPCIDAGDDLVNPQANQPSGSGGIPEDTFDADGNSNFSEKTPDIDKAQRIYGARLDQGPSRPTATQIARATCTRSARATAWWTLTTYFRS
jgi:hypothetical protein